MAKKGKVISAGRLSGRSQVLRNHRWRVSRNEGGTGHMGREGAGSMFSSKNFRV